MKNKNTQKLTLAAMVAAAYAVLSLLGAVFGITYGPIQVRFSEALCLLPFLFPETAWGLGVGCLIANLFSPYGVLDIVVGSLATLIAALITSRCRNVWLAALPPVACNMVLVGAVLAYEQAGTSAAFLARLWAQRRHRGRRRGHRLPGAGGAAGEAAAQDPLFPGPAPIQINRINRPAAPMGGRFLMESVRYCPG